MNELINYDDEILSTDQWVIREIVNMNSNYCTSTTINTSTLQQKWRLLYHSLPILQK